MVCSCEGLVLEHLGMHIGLPLARREADSFFIKEVDDAVTAVLAPPTLMNWTPGDEGRVSVPLARPR